MLEPGRVPLILSSTSVLSRVWPSSFGLAVCGSNAEMPAAGSKNIAGFGAFRVSKSVFL
jgi:hypothetical protein